MIAQLEKEYAQKKKVNAPITIQLDMSSHFYFFPDQSSHHMNKNS